MSSIASQVALVTGATGFIGAHLTSRLVRDGWDVHLLVRPGSDLTPLAEVREQVRSHSHDGTTGGLLSIMEAVAPDVVFHLASLFIAEHRPADIERMIESNLLFATQLSESMVNCGVWRLVNTGTSWQHYESREYSPVNLYAATKQAFEAILRYYVESTQLRAVTLKLFDTYGPGDRRPKLFRLLRQLAAQSEPLAMSPGEQLIDLVHVDDVVEAFLLAAEMLFNGEVDGNEDYAVTSGSPISLKALVAQYSSLLGRDLPITWGGRPYRSREVMVPWHSGPTLPGWQPRVPLGDGLLGIIAEVTGHSDR